MYILTDETYENLKRELEDEYIKLRDKCNYNTALKQRIEIENSNKERNQETIKQLIIDLNFVKSDIVKLSVKTDILSKILKDIDATKNNVRFYLIILDESNQVQYQEIKSSYTDFVPQQNEIIVISGEYFCVTKRIFNIDNNILDIYLSKTKRCGHE